jgi:hypothetical protein
VLHIPSVIGVLSNVMMYTETRGLFIRETALRAKHHYVYPCQRFSSGNTLEDYNP